MKKLLQWFITLLTISATVMMLGLPVWWFWGEIATQGWQAIGRLLLDAVVVVLGPLIALGLLAGLGRGLDWIGKSKRPRS